MANEKKELTLFEKLNAINVSDKTEKKNGLTYLSWAWAWGELKKICPNANYKVYERTTIDGYEVNYFTDGRTCWVKVGVICDGLEHIEMLPVMDYKNQSIPLEKVSSFDVNKSIQRALTKAIGRFGLGLYIYAGEDLPESESDEKSVEKINAKAESVKITPKQLEMIKSLTTAEEQANLEKNIGKFENWSVKTASDIIARLQVAKGKGSNGK